MINIFFVPGMFGTTLEYLLRQFTEEILPGEEVEVRSDGSMHSVKKEWHPHELDHLTYLPDEVKIATPIYPFRNAKLKSILDNWPGNLNESKNIFIRAKNVQDAELNLIFHSRKVAIGLNKGPASVLGEGSGVDVSKWNPNYTHWSEMSTWELREWISLQYLSRIKEWIHIEKDTAHINKLIINNVDLLSNLEDEFLRITKYCNLTPSNDNKRKLFIKEWTDKQQYIFDEFNLIGQIVEKTLHNEDFEWHRYRLNVLTQAIIQQRLRTHGYELKCHGLDLFPTSSEELYNLLEKN